MAKLELVFVYGTLKQSFPNHRLLREGRFLGRAITAEAYALFVDDEGIPHVYPDRQVSPIHGELYEVDSQTLACLDALEEHPHLYRRTAVEVIAGNGQQHIAWIYLSRQSSGRLIPSGDYTLADSGPTARKT